MKSAVRLFCFPYAGGGASAFHDWKKIFDSNRIEVHPVVYPGRESRLNEPCSNHLSDLVDTLIEELTPQLTIPFAFLGHSLGATVCFEIARRLHQEGFPPPFRIFVAGCGAPQLPDPNPLVHTLPEEAFITELKKLNGMPTEILDTPELLELFLPVIRADYRAHETYRFIEGPKLECPISVLGGRDDETVDLDRLEAWGEQTTESTKIHLIPGDHFFINSAMPAVSEVVSEDLNRVPASTLYSE